MEEPEKIFETLADFFASRQGLKGKKVLITAGPTYEKIDPVRFIGNYSSGKMGYALAETCAAQGAEVTVVSGPVALTAKHQNIHIIHVESAAEMYTATTGAFPKADVGILCAAVADFTPATTATEKIKREGDTLHLDLVATRDIAAALGQAKRTDQKLIGFALETTNEKEHAKAKLAKKHLDFIVLNSLNDKGAGFAHDTNKVTIIAKNEERVFELKSKSEVAQDIIDYLCESFD